MAMIRVGILTISDTCSEGRAEDKSGATLADLVTKDEFEVTLQLVIGDDINSIQGVLCKWCDDGLVDVILTTGGTGFTQRDVTPEATRQILEKDAPAICVALTMASLQVTPLAMLSRLVAGIRKSVLIVNFPGSPKACKECYAVISPVIRHAVDQLKGHVGVVRAIHQKLQAVNGMSSGVEDEKEQYISQTGDTLIRLTSRVKRISPADRARTSAFKMLEVNEAMDVILNNVNQSDQKECISIKNVGKLVGRVLAQDVHAYVPLPPFPASMKDGYAVIAADGPGVRLVHHTSSTAGSSVGLASSASNTIIEQSEEEPKYEFVDGVLQPPTSRSNGLKYPVTNRLKFLADIVIKALMEHRFAWPFLYPQYNSPIKHPMDLQTIKDRLENGYYMSAAQCINDFKKVFIDCYSFYEQGEDVFLMAQALEKFFFDKLGDMPMGEEIELDRIEQTDDQTIPQAGVNPFHLEVVSGSCVRINTGAPVPTGANAVVQVEDTQLLESSPDGEELKIMINKFPTVGQDIRKIGDDIAAGERVLNQYASLNASELGIIAAVGLDKVEVVKQPVVGLLSTGDEIIAAGDRCKEGHVWDSNKTTLMALLHQLNITPVDLGIAKDDADTLYTSFVAAFEQVDLLITTGGVSMGERDLIKRVLTEDFSATIHFGRVNLKPGKPTVFATCDWKAKKKTIFALPGNPVSAYVTCLLFAFPAIRVICGEVISKDAIDALHMCHKTVKAKLMIKQPIKLDERPEFVRGIITFSETGAQVELIKGSQRSSRLMSTKDANVLVILPSSSVLAEVQPYQIVDAILL